MLYGFHSNLYWTTSYLIVFDQKKKTKRRKKRPRVYTLYVHDHLYLITSKIFLAREKIVSSWFHTYQWVQVKGRRSRFCIYIHFCIMYICVTQELLYYTYDMQSYDIKFAMRYNSNSPHKHGSSTKHDLGPFWSILLLAWYLEICITFWSAK